MPGARRGGRDLARVVGLDAADRDERVAALGERVGDEVLELARLVAAVGEAAVAVVALGPDRGAAEVARQPVEAVDGRRAEQQRVAGERVEAHRAPSDEGEVAGHEDVVDVAAVEVELLAQHALDDEPGALVERPGGGVRAEDAERETAGSAGGGLARGGIDERAPDALPAAAGVDGEAGDRDDVAVRRDGRRRADPDVADDRAAGGRDEDVRPAASARRRTASRAAAPGRGWSATTTSAGRGPPARPRRSGVAGRTVAALIRRPRGGRRAGSRAGRRRASRARRRRRRRRRGA